jgi:hypothetical protein
VNFATRSYRKELLDGDDIPAADIRLNMRELDFINTYLGGHKITLKGFQSLLAGLNNPKREIHVCEIGCGGGDNLYVIWKWCEQHKVQVKLTGIDINQDCITVAKEKLQGAQAEFIVSDYSRVKFPEKPDLIFSSLFCHHFVESDLIFMLNWMNQNAATGFFINDLHRHPLAYYSIRLLTRFFSSSYLVKNDAPLSVLRGFSAEEWKKLLEASSVQNFTVQWKWAFRHLITVSHRRSELNSQHVSQISRTGES